MVRCCWRQHIGAARRCPWMSPDVPSDGQCDGSGGTRSCSRCSARRSASGGRLRTGEFTHASCGIARRRRYPSPPCRNASDGAGAMTAGARGNQSTAADILVETLLDWGVDIIFGLPGDGINGIIEALRVRQDRIRFIVARHEEAAAFMACAYAKWTGKLGCCLATTGPGGIHLLNGLYDAKFDRAPVLAITGL